MKVNHESYIRAEVTYVTRTDEAILIEWDEGKEWVPRSTLSYRCDQKIKDLRPSWPFQIEIAEWKAIQIGLAF